MKTIITTSLVVNFLLFPGIIAGAAIGAGSLWFWPVYFLFLTAVLYSWFFSEKKSVQLQINLKASLNLLDNTWVFFLALGLFLCAGAEVSMSTGLIIWLREEHLLSGFPLWGTWFIFLFFLFAGRLMYPLIFRFLRPGPHLLFSVLFVVAGILMLIMGGLLMAVFGIILTGLGLSGIFFLISTLMMQAQPGREKEIRGLMLLSLPAAALLPPFMLWINYGGGTGLGFVVPLFTVLYVFFLAIIGNQDKETV